uniref:Uncharacterized protein n=1 Tax=Strix occidentalis caurina TaxID=311401 RepID=A0A8D0KW90_STROC
MAALFFDSLSPDVGLVQPEVNVEGRSHRVSPLHQTISPCVRLSILQPGSADKARSALCGDVLSTSSLPYCLAGPVTFSRLPTKHPSGICSDNCASRWKSFP